MFEARFYYFNNSLNADSHILGSDGTWRFSDLKTIKGVINRLKRGAKASPIATKCLLFWNNAGICEVPILLIGSEYVPDKPKYDENNRVYFDGREYATDEQVKWLKSGEMEIIINPAISSGNSIRYLSKKDLFYKKLSDNTWALYRKS